MDTTTTHLIITPDRILDADTALVRMEEILRAGDDGEETQD